MSGISVALALVVLVGCVVPGTVDQVLEVAIEAPTSTLDVGDVVTLEAVVTAVGSANTDVTWSSNVSAVATVSQSGVLTALSGGTTSVRATSVFDPDMFATATVHVLDDGDGMSIRWTRDFGTADREAVVGMSVDSQGQTSTIGTQWTPTTGGRGEEALVTSFLRWYDSNGSYAGGMSWEPGAFTAVAHDATDDLLLAGESFVWKYVDGSHVWTADLGSVSTVLDVATDSARNVIAVGSTTGNVLGTNAGSSDAFVRRFSPTGSVLWTRQFGTSEWDVAIAVAIDAVDNLYVVGTTYGSLVDSVGGDQGATFVVKFDSAGNALWSRQFGFAAFAQDIVVDANGNAYVVGFAWGEVGSGQYVLTGTAGFISKFSSGGATLWSHLLEDNLETSAWGVAIGPSSTVLVAGSVHDEVGTGGTQDSSDALVRAYNADGSTSWTHRFGTSATDVARAIVVAPNGDIVVSGETYGNLVGQNAGRADGFVRRLSY